MPELTNPQHEAFAQALVAGASQKKAYEEAGFNKPHGGNASRVANYPDVAERVKELKRRRHPTAGACLTDTITRLLALADTCGAMKTAASQREARMACLDAYRLWEILQRQEKKPRLLPHDVQLTEAEWVAKYGVTAPA